jgi:putative ABC transport system permease protein
LSQGGNKIILSQRQGNALSLQNPNKMLKNYLKIALRNLLRNKVYSFINIGGLAVGMAVAMLIGLWIYDELSFNKYHKDYDKIAQVMQNQTFNGTVNSEMSVPMPLGEALKLEYQSDFKNISMAWWVFDHILSFGENKISIKGTFMEANAPELLSLSMIKGTWAGLNDPNSILLSQSLAKSLFGDADPMGKVIKINNKMPVKVTGIYKDLPYNCRFDNVKFLSSWDLWVSNNDWIKNSKDNWGNNSFNIFVELNANADFDIVSEKIKNVKLNKVTDKNDKIANPTVFLHPMKKWHLYSEWKNGVYAGGRIQYVWLFSIIGIFVLLLACINFMNLSTARSEKRAKEVGVRKAIGSIRIQLVTQFFSESILVVLFAFVLSIVLVHLVLPYFNEIADKRICILWSNTWFWLIGLGFSLLTGLIAGSYPAFYLSSFKPVKVLKGTFRVGRFAAIPRKILVVTQFTVSITLIIGTIIVFRQIQFAKNRPIGYTREGLLMIQMKSQDFYGKFEVLRTALKNTNVVAEMSESSSPATEVWSSSGGFDWKGKNSNFQTDFATISVTQEYGKTVGWQFKDGRDFSRDFATDSSAIVLNEASVKFMGLKNPVGETIRWDGKPLKIIGVIKNMIMESPYEPVKQTIFYQNYDNVNWINIKINPNVSASQALPKIEAIFKKLIPAAPFDYKFADTEYDQKFRSEERIGELSNIFAILAIFISCLGLFGLSSFVAEQRTKEIGIRKVLGATVMNLWTLLSKDFVILVIISCLIAAPIAYYFMNQWLQKYTYRTEISWWIFVVAGAGALLITLLTVSYQAIRAALMNPVKSLRTE